MPAKCGGKCNVETQHSKSMPQSTWTHSYHNVDVSMQTHAYTTAKQQHQASATRPICCPLAFEHAIGDKHAASISCNNHHRQLPLLVFKSLRKL